MPRRRPAQLGMTVASGAAKSAAFDKLTSLVASVPTRGALEGCQPDRARGLGCEAKGTRPAALK